MALPNECVHCVMMQLKHTFVGKNMCRGFTLMTEIRTIGKGKGHPRTGHEGLEGESRYSCTLSLTMALDGGGWSTPRPGRFTPGKDPVPIVQEAV